MEDCLDDQKNRWASRSDPRLPFCSCKQNVVTAVLFSWSSFRKKINIHTTGSVCTIPYAENKSCKTNCHLYTILKTVHWIIRKLVDAWQPSEHSPCISGRCDWQFTHFWLAAKSIVKVQNQLLRSWFEFSDLGNGTSAKQNEILGWCRPVWTEDIV